MVAENQFSVKMKRAERKVVLPPALSTMSAFEEQNIMSERDSICVREEKLVEYRAIAGYPGYRVGNDGTVWSCWRKGAARKNYQSENWRQLVLCAGNNDYRIVGLTAHGKKTTLYVHEIVLNAFIGPRPEPTMQARHFPDSNPLNNSVENLLWGTPSENNRDKELQGTHQIGEKNPRAKLNVAAVLEIRRRYSAGEQKRIIANDYGVSPTLVRLIALRKCWKHVA